MNVHFYCLISCCLVFCWFSLVKLDVFYPLNNDIMHYFYMKMVDYHLSQLFLLLEILFNYLINWVQWPPPHHVSLLMTHKITDGSKHFLLYFNHFCDNLLYTNLAALLQLLFHYIIFYFDWIPQLARVVISWLLLYLFCPSIVKNPVIVTTGTF